jgi:hypothetical protein
MVDQPRRNLRYPSIPTRISINIVKNSASIVMFRCSVRVSVTELALHSTLRTVPDKPFAAVTAGIYFQVVCSFLTL